MSSKHSRRAGTTLTELVVAAGIAVTAMSIVASLAVRCGRLWQDTRHQQMAMDELSNELERLIGLSAEQREAAIAELAHSPQLRSALPSAELQAETIRDQHGERLALSLNWDRLGNPPAVTFVGWIDSAADSTVQGRTNSEPRALAAARQSSRQTVVERGVSQQQPSEARVDGSPAGPDSSVQPSGGTP